ENEPVNYRPTGEKVQGPAPIFLTTELIDEHIAWAVRAKKVTSEKWEARKKSHLRWWMKRLHGGNLRRRPKGKTPHAPPSPGGSALGGRVGGVLEKDPLGRNKPVKPGMRTKLIAVIKALYGWL